MSLSHDRRRLWTKALLLIASTLTVMAGTAVAPVLPQLGNVFDDRSQLLVRLVLTLPALVIAVGALFAGVLVDRFGRVPLLIGSVALYGVAGGAGLVVEGLDPLLVSRALLGLGVAGLMTAINTLNTDYFEGTERETMMGWQGTFMAFGGVVFLLGGGALADLHWRAPFATYLPALVLVPAMMLVMREPARPAQVPGAGAIITATAPWPVIGLIYGTAALVMLTFFLIPVQVPFLLADLGVTSGFLIGVALAMVALMAAAVASRFAWLRARLSDQGIFAFAFAMAAIAYTLLALADHWWIVYVATMIAGLGMGPAMPNAQVWLARVAPVAVRGRLFGGLTSAVFLGQFLSPLISQPLIDGLGMAGGFGVLAAFQAVVALAFAGYDRMRA